MQKYVENFIKSPVLIAIRMKWKIYAFKWVGNEQRVKRRRKLH